MTKKYFTILPLASALAALVGEAPAATANVVATEPEALLNAGVVDQIASPASAYFQVGHDLLGMTIEPNADGMIVAGHSSHASHSSHSSHSSSRY